MHGRRRLFLRRRVGLELPRAAGILLMAATFRRPRTRFLAAWAAILLSVGCGHRENVNVIADTKPSEDPTNEMFNYDRYAKVLNAHVNVDGLVNYAALQSERADLDAFIAALGIVTQTEISAWDPNARFAFWINAYNAITLRRIVDHYPIKKGGLIAGIRYPENSIRQIPGVWDTQKSIVAGRDVTLDEIEHEVLRPEFKDPRVHAAIVCASIGCPPLRNGPFIGEGLDEQLDDQMRKFLTRVDVFRIDREKNKIYISSIFDWFDEDFSESYKTESGYPGQDPARRAVLNFVSKYVSDADARFLRENSYNVVYTYYDWTLNEQPK